VKTTNPVLVRLGQAAERERAAGYAPVGPYGQPAYGQPYPTATGYPTAPPTVQPMSIDDVIVKTVALLGLLGVTAVASWVLIPDALLGGAWIGAAVVTLVLGLIISFARVTNPALVGTYAVVQGVFVGVVSKVFASAYSGIVPQAVVASFSVFFLMAMLYKLKVIRATPRFVRGVVAAVLGLGAVMLINFVLWIFGVDTGLRSGGPLSIVFSLVCIVVASLSFVVSFDQIEQGVRMGLPQRYSWTAAFGILVGLVWLYLEILRLLRFLQGNN
jgi:uncharacterized YccA/Bax inhibitor family protein